MHAISLLCATLLTLAAAPALDTLYREIELPVAEVLYRMERTGVLIDSQRLAQQSQQLAERMLALARDEAAGTPSVLRVRLHQLVPEYAPR